MKPRKKFIAGAICPGCKQTDTLALFHIESEEVVECVRCQCKLPKPKSMPTATPGSVFLRNIK